MRAHSWARLGQFRVKSGRADFMGGPGLVLGLVVEKGILAGGDDLHQGQGLKLGVAQHPAGNLGALDEFLHQHPVIQGEGRGQAGCRASGVGAMEMPMLEPSLTGLITTGSPRAASISWGRGRLSRGQRSGPGAP